MSLRGNGLGWFGFGLLLVISFVETINPAGCVYQFLFSCEERMTRRTNFDVKVVLTRRACRKRLATGALYLDFVIFRMDSLLHLGPGFLRMHR